MARPSKYKKAYCQQIIDFMAKGNSAVQFAAEIGVSKDSLYEWVKNYQEFSDAFKLARARCESHWEKIMQAKAIGNFKDKNGVKLKGSDACMIFWMKNRFGWTDRNVIEHSGVADAPPIKTEMLSLDVTKLSTDQLKSIREALNIDDANNKD